MVVQLFGEVENKNVPIPEFPEHPFQEEQLKVSCEGVRTWLCFAESKPFECFLASSES